MDTVWPHRCSSDNTVWWWSGASSPPSAATKPTRRRAGGLRWVTKVSVGSFPWKVTSNWDFSHQEKSLCVDLSPFIVVYDRADLCLRAVIKVDDWNLPIHRWLTAMLKFTAESWSGLIIIAWTTHTEVSPSGLKYLVRLIFSFSLLKSAFFSRVFSACLFRTQIHVFDLIHLYWRLPSLSDPVWTCSTVSFNVPGAFVLQFHAGSQQTEDTYLSS